MTGAAVPEHRYGAKRSLAVMGTVTHIDEVRRSRKTGRHTSTETRAARARRYRHRAEELRSISEEVILKETCLTLLSLAESYDQMASFMEKTTLREG